MMIDYGPSPSVRARWKKGAGIRAMKRHASKAYHAGRDFIRDIAAIWSMLRPVPVDPAMRGVICRALMDGETGGRTVIRDGNAFEQRRGPHFHDTVQA